MSILKRAWAAFFVLCASALVWVPFATPQTLIQGRSYGTGQNLNVAVDSNGALITSPDGGASSVPPGAAYLGSWGYGGADGGYYTSVDTGVISAGNYGSLFIMFTNPGTGNSSGTETLYTYNVQDAGFAMGTLNLTVEPIPLWAGATWGHTSAYNSNYSLITLTSGTAITQIPFNIAPQFRIVATSGGAGAYIRIDIWGTL